MAGIYRTKFYPVDVDRKVIYLDPFARERDLAWKWRSVPGCIGIPGSRLLEHACYAEYQQLPPPAFGKKGHEMSAEDFHRMIRREESLRNAGSLATYHEATNETSWQVAGITVGVSIGPVGATRAYFAALGPTYS